MTVKLVLLKSGENIISDVKEGISEDKVVTFILNNPCSISINGTYKILEDEDTGDFENKVSISLSSWPSLSEDKVVPIPTDWVVTIVEPNQQVKDMYETQVMGIKKDENYQSVSFTEQSDTNQSD